MPSSAPSERGGATLSFVIPWFGPDAGGGAELQGWETARELAARGYAVEILTTCSRSFLHRWDENYHRPGEEMVQGVRVRRFPVNRRDERLFGTLNQALLSGVSLLPDQEEQFVRQNINSTGLCDFIREKGADRIFVFLPYLYGTTLEGAAVRPDRSLIMPCFHDEAYAYLEVTRRVFGGVRGMIYLTPEEADAVRKAMGRELPGVVVGGGIDTGLEGSPERFREQTGIREPFLLYIGRLDRGKNTHLLVSYFGLWNKQRGRQAKLVLVGGGDFPLPGGGEIVRLTVAGNQGKMDACAAALALCQPSVNESFSRVIMEAWLNRVPVMVSGRCPVTVGHCRRGGGGLFFDDYFEFAGILDLYLADAGLRLRLGEAGREYVLQNCHWDTVCRRFTAAVESLSGEKVARSAPGGGAA